MAEIAIIIAAACGIVLGYLTAAKSFTRHGYRRALVDVMNLVNEKTNIGSESPDAFALRLQIAGMIASFDILRKKS